jgi:hypothetical protein
MYPIGLRRTRLGAAATGLALAMAGCNSPPVETPPTPPPGHCDLCPRAPPKNRVDVLFMVDNRTHMVSMQAELHKHFGEFFKVFNDLAAKGTYADLHIGVVTGDYGAGNTTFGLCDASPGGQRGILQNLPSPTIQPTDAQPPPNCMAPTGATPAGTLKRYIEYAFGPMGPTSNLPTGQDLLTTFTCMAAVGAHGCGFQHPLESVYAALHNNVENDGFLRDNARLTVVFVTNEDDSSAPPDTDIFDPNKSSTYGYYDKYRKTRYGIACGNPLMLPPYGPSNGMLLGCQSAPNNSVEQIGREYDIQRYVDFFTKPKPVGVKYNPDDVILVGIDAPTTSFETLLVDWTSGRGIAPNPSYVTCSPLNPPTCLVRLQHSCQNNVQPVFFGDPAIRLNTVILSAKYNQITSICGDSLDVQPDYTPTLQQLANLIASFLTTG